MLYNPIDQRMCECGSHVSGTICPAWLVLSESDPRVLRSKQWALGTHSLHPAHWTWMLEWVNQISSLQNQNLETQRLRELGAKSHSRLSTRVNITDASNPLNSPGFHHSWGLVVHHFVRNKIIHINDLSRISIIILRKSFYFCFLSS